MPVESPKNNRLGPTRAHGLSYTAKTVSDWVEEPGTVQKAIDDVAAKKFEIHIPVITAAVGV